MRLTKDVKQYIDSMNYERLLSVWRFSPVGTPMFEGESGDYYKQQMDIKEREHTNPAMVSKVIGWK